VCLEHGCIPFQFELQVLGLAVSFCPRQCYVSQIDPYYIAEHAHTPDDQIDRRTNESAKRPKRG